VIRFLKSEAGAVVLWVLGSMLLAAVITPWMHQAGKNLAAHVAIHDAAAWIEWLGTACDRARFSRYFNRALMLSSVVLLPAMFGRIRYLRRKEPLPPKKAAALSASHGIAQWFTGLILAGGLLWMLGMALELAGAFEPTAKQISLGRIMSKAVVPALAVSVIEEWLFRGLLLGIWLKLAKPIPACIGTSLVFAFVHFLEPANGAEIEDPFSAGAGFVLLGRIFSHFMAPQFIIAEFSTLFTVGLILAWAKIRTNSLWFPMGLHTGWILAFKGYNMIKGSVDGSPLRPWWIGDSLGIGLFPILTLLLTGWLCHVVVRRFFARTSA